MLLIHKNVTPIKEKEAVSVIVASLIAYNAAEPLIDEILSRAGLIWLYAPESCHGVIIARRPSLSERLMAYEQLELSQPWIKWLHKFLLVCLVPWYSRNFYFHLLMVLKVSPQWWVLFIKIHKFLKPKETPATVNKRISRILRLFVRNAFRTKRVLAVTHLTVPHLLCSKDLDVTTLVESWDHPGKFPNGYVSRKVFIWNEALASDWRNFQGDSEVEVGYPLKLAYALEASVKKSKIQFWENRRILYPATFSSYSHPSFFREELRLLDLLCSAAASNNVRIYIKPKPNGPLGDFECLKGRQKNIEVGDDGGATGPTSYFLDEIYNKKRLTLMRKCDAVVNLGTTFGLDAAAFGLPVFQLFIKDQFMYPYLTSAYLPYHLQHLISRADEIYEISPKISAENVFEKMFKPPNSAKAVGLSQNLREWLCDPKTSCKNAVIRMVDSFLQMNK